MVVSWWSNYCGCIFQSNIEVVVLYEWVGFWGKGLIQGNLAIVLLVAMASMFMVKNSFFKVTKVGVPSQVSSLYPRKVSRVCFTSASSKFHESGEDAKAAERMREARQVYESDQEAQQVERKYSEMKQKAKDSMNDMKEGTKESAEWAKQKAQQQKEKANQGAERVGQTMHDAKESTKETAKEGTDKVGETIHNVNEKVKETAKGAWESAKDATQKIKETVVGEDDKMRVDDYVENHLPPKRHPGDDQKHRP